LSEYEEELKEQIRFLRIREGELCYQIRMLKDLVKWFYDEREQRRAPNMINCPWGIRTATGMKNKNNNTDAENDDEVRQDP
jgi:hypothetical protein